MLVHLDTDLGGDIDDVCALALLLGQSVVELAGITTVADRAGYARYSDVLATGCLHDDAPDGWPVILSDVVSVLRRS